MHIHILGICGTFMGGVAALAREAGHKVTGCDSGVYPPMSDQLRALGDFARQRDLTELQVAFSWLASRPAVSSVIAGATRTEQVQANAEAAGWVPTPDDEAELDEIFPPVPKVALF